MTELIISVLFIICGLALAYAWILNSNSDQ
jgi:hypothetical protein